MGLAIVVAFALGFAVGAAVSALFEWDRFGKKPAPYVPDCEDHSFSGWSDTVDCCGVAQKRRCVVCGLADKRTIKVQR